jgi:iron(III) transport system permease protein
VDRTGIFIAFLLLGAVVLAPVGAMVWESVTVDAVETRDGSRYLGFVTDSDETGVTIRVAGETNTRHLPAADIVSRGRVPSLENYRSVLAHTGERSMLLATVVLAGVSTLLAILIGLPLGLLLAATNIPMRRTLEMVSVLPLVLPPILLAIAAYHDLLAVEPEFLRAAVVFGLSLFPLVSLLTARAVRAAGAEALDAARIQTGPWNALLKVGLRPALPGAASGALLVFVFVVSDFAVPDFLGVTTAQNTITVYANAVFNYWSKDGNAGAATAAGMPVTLLALAAFATVLVVEWKRDAATVTTRFREIEPMPLGRARWPLFLAVVLLLLLTVGGPMVRHLQTTGGAHYGSPVSQGGVAGTQPSPDEIRAKPLSVWAGLKKGVQYTGIGDNVVNSLVLASGGALLALLLAIVLTGAGQGRPVLDRFLLVCSFLPVAVPPMVLAVGWVRLYGPWTHADYFPVVLMGARLLPFATLAVRAARRQVAGELLEAASLSGLGPAARTLRITLPLIAPGAALGFLLAFLFGLREVDAVIFTKSGAQTLPVRLYGMIHTALDVQVAGLAALWTAGNALLLVILRIMLGSRFRLLP